MGDADAAGTAVTGALIGRAVEPHAGEAGHGEAHGACLNCGTTLVGPHCHNCGQSDHVHKTMSAIGHDIAHGVFHFEGKIFRTLPLLAFKPGELTRRYIDGERARFVSPMALFLFSVFLMFAVVANLPGWNFGGEDLLKPGLNGGVAQAREKLGEERANAASQRADLLATLATERAKKAPDAAKIARIEKRVAEAAEAERGLAQAQKILPPPTTFNVEGTPPPTANNWLDAKFRKALENPKLLLYKVKTSAYKFSWALIPLSVPILWLLFPFSRRFGLYDHAVFVTYSLTFMSLLAIVLALLGTIGVPWQALVVAAVFIPPFHIYRQMKGSYGLGRANALIRTTLLISGILWVVLPLVAIGLAYLGVAD